MSNLISLKQERATKLRELRKVVEAAEAANNGRGRPLTDDERRMSEATHDRIAEINSELEGIESQRSALGRPMTRAAAQGLGGRDATDNTYNTVRDAGTEPRSWAADVLAAAKGDAEARDALTAYTRRVDDLERRSGLLVGTSTAGSEFASPVLTDMGEGANIPRVYGRYYSAQAEALPLGSGSEFVVPQATTGSTVAATAEAGAVTFTDWVTATLTLDVKTIAGGVTLSQQFADLAPAFANAAIAADLSGKFNQALESYAVTSSDTNAKGLQNISGIQTVVTTGTDNSVLWLAILEAIYKLAGSGAYCDAEAIVMHPLQWANILGNKGLAPVAGTAIDSRPQGVAFPEGSAVNAYARSNGKMLGDVGTMFGVPVIATPACAVENTDEYRVYVVNRTYGHRLFTSPMRTRIATQVGIATLSPKVVVFAYVAQYAPHAGAIVQVNGEATEAVDLTA